MATYGLTKYDPISKRYLCKAGHKHVSEDSALYCHWCKRDMEAERTKLEVKPDDDPTTDQLKYGYGDDGEPIYSD